MRPLIVFLCAMLVSYGVPAAAERPAHVGGPRWIGGDPDDRIAELQAKRDRIVLRGPTIGMISGGIATLVGAGILVSGGIGCRYGGDIYFQEHVESCGDGTWNPYWISGGVIAGLGLLTLSTSAAVFASRKKQKKALDREILELRGERAARAAPAWTMSMGLGEHSGIRFGLRF